MKSTSNAEERVIYDAREVISGLQAPIVMNPEVKTMYFSLACVILPLWSQGRMLSSIQIFFNILCSWMKLCCTLSECVANRNSRCLGWVKRSHLEQRLGKSKRSKENCGGKTEGASERKRGKGGKLDPKTLPGVLHQRRGLELFTHQKVCPSRSNCHLVIRQNCISMFQSSYQKSYSAFITNSVRFKTQNRILYHRNHP